MSNEEKKGCDPDYVEKLLKNLKICYQDIGDLPHDAQINDKQLKLLEKIKKTNPFQNDAIKRDKVVKSGPVELQTVDGENVARPIWMSPALFVSSLRPIDECHKILVKCKGCNQVFESESKCGAFFRHRFEYYIHCIEQCDKYKDLNLIQECKSCNLKFLNHISLSLHNYSVHKDTQLTNRVETIETVKPVKPNWMTSHTFNRSIRPLNPEVKVNVACPGCNRMFKAEEKSGRHQYEFSYYVHCIDYCQEYRKLGLIRECEQCKHKFINPSSFRVHLRCHNKC